ncbi:MAG: type VI secretion system baseplate subunit TssG [Casimicrobiaceae bacterium]|nr:type VI secretion system baseplate subunit TssG [Casimicrobiaceae bacterium]MDW8311722.1 type VI secretion system baseplate subunit TssG [Burkholderiales bacterium]
MSSQAPLPTSDHPDRSGASKRAARRAWLWQLLERSAPDVDFYVALRHVDAFLDTDVPLGRAARPIEEPIRLSQYPSLIFAPSALHRFEPSRSGEPYEGRLSVYHFGLFGPNGPLPTHLTEYVQERLIHHQDPTLLRFLDLFQHRMLLLFYRAWADCQSTVSLDRPGKDRFTRYVASLTGYGQPTLRDRDSVPDHWKFGLSGHLVRMTRNAEGLRASLMAILRVAVEVVPFVPHWLRLDEAERTRLGGIQVSGPASAQRVETGAQSSRLGRGAVAGERVLDVQHRFRIRIGPLTYEAFERFLPGREAFVQLRDFVRNYIGMELAWDAQLILRREQVPTARLGAFVRLGWSSWLAMPSERRLRDADEVFLQCERFAG